MTMVLHDINGPLVTTERSQRVFAGELLVFRQVPGLVQLCDYSDHLLRAGFGDDPARAEYAMAPGEYRRRRRQLCQTFESDPQVQRYLLETLAGVGVDLAQCHWDRLCLRVLPCDPTLAGHRRTTPPHRDTWGSALHAQVNWWAPLQALDPRHTLVFYPDYWQQPLANTSGEWRFEDLLAHRRRREYYPSAPTLKAPLAPTETLAILIEPGDLLCFSGAQLHATVPNQAGRARFSIETRTLHQEDLQAGRAAPNVDCDPRRQPHREWFRPLLG